MSHRSNSYLIDETISQKNMSKQFDDGEGSQKVGEVQEAISDNDTPMYFPGTPVVEQFDDVREETKGNTSKFAAR